MQKPEQNASKWAILIQFIKFNCVGVLNTLIDLGSYSLLTYLGCNIYLAQVIAYTLGVTNSWIFNSRWTFNDKQVTGVRLLLFILVNLAALGMQTVILWFGTTRMGWSPIISKIVAIPFGLVVNFLGNRLIVFRKSNETK